MSSTGLFASVALALAISSPALAAPAKAPGLTGMWLLDPSAFETRPQAVLTPEAKVAAEEQRKILAAGGGALSDNSRKCLPTGMPGMMTNEFALEILETPGRVTVLSEANIVPRTIRLDRKTPVEVPDPTWNGQSVGHWEGAALVVETTGLNDRVVRVPGGGIPSTTLKIVERWSLADGGKTLVNQMTLTDPKVLAAPYVRTVSYSRMEPDAQLWEYVCEVDAEGWSDRFQGDPEGAAKLKTGG